MCNFKVAVLHVDEISVIIVNMACAICKNKEVRAFLLKGLFTCAILRLQCCMLMGLMLSL